MVKFDLKLQSFEGPLDLLLHLIEKNKLDIRDIPIMLITDQYLEQLEEMQQNQLDSISEFVEMAATLIQIKTKMLLPRQKDENNQDIDPRQELMEQLLEYKKFKLISSELREKEKEAERSFFKSPSIPQEIKDFVPQADPEDLLKGLDFSRLYTIFYQMMRRNNEKIDPIRSRFGTIKRESYTIQDKMKAILSKRLESKHISYRSLLKAQASKSEMIATFLAILELMKESKIRVNQVRLFNDIQIEFVD